ncbi:MAG: hypothetical protein ABUJ92_00140 [Desulfobacterales bacterium]
MIDWTKPVQTKDGRPVTIWTTESKVGVYPVRGEFLFGGEWKADAWAIDGNLFHDGSLDDKNLMNVPEEIEGWVNIYEYGGTISVGPIRKDEALSASHRENNCIACIKIKFTKGEGL